MEKETKKEDILEQVKKAEKLIKMNLLLKQLATLKKLAKEVLVAKEKSVLILEEVGVSQEDVKRVIDFINSSPEVQLSESDKKDLREDVKEEHSKKREEVQKEIEKHPFYGGSSLNYFSTDSSVNWGTSTSALTLTNTAGGNLKVNL